MDILRYNKDTDFDEVIKLFYDTIYVINSKDYTKTQLDAWANIDKKRWETTLFNNYSLVAKKKDIIIGFSDITDDGYLDRMFVHKDYQKMGVGSILLKNLENYAISNNITYIHTNASITAKNFFIKNNFKVLNEQQVKVNGVYLTNFKMIKKV